MRLPEWNADEVIIPLYSWVLLFFVKKKKREQKKKKKKKKKTKKKKTKEKKKKQKKKQKTKKKKFLTLYLEQTEMKNLPIEWRLEGEVKLIETLMLRCGIVMCFLRHLNRRFVLQHGPDNQRT